ncbi:hypothetical protein HON52_00795 [Candidatus Uhrbacteria bacterium]|nr:hypothetical protein [Candidatus Uhrbacteria bacterium]
MIRFLIMYCPSIVGTNGDCQTASGTKISGPKVVIIWTRSIGRAYFVHFFTRNSIPISISRSPRKIKKLLKGTPGIVIVKRLLTISSAGDMKRIFRNPNQKKTMNIAIRLYQSDWFSVMENFNIYSKFYYISIALLCALLIGWKTKEGSTALFSFY